MLDKYNEAKSKVTKFVFGTHDSRFDYQGWNRGWQDGFDDYDNYLPPYNKRLDKSQIIDTTKNKDNKRRNKGNGKQNSLVLEPSSYIPVEIKSIIKNPEFRVETWGKLFAKLNDKNIESLLSDFTSIESVRLLEKLYVDLYRLNISQDKFYYPQYFKVLNLVSSLYE